MHITIKTRKEGLAAMSPRSHCNLEQYQNKNAPFSSRFTNENWLKFLLPTEGVLPHRFCSHKVSSDEMEDSEVLLSSANC